MDAMDLSVLADRMFSIRESLQEQKIMAFSGTSSTEAETRILVEVVDVLEAVILHLQQVELRGTPPDESSRTQGPIQVVVVHTGRCEEGDLAT